MSQEPENILGGKCRVTLDLLAERVAALADTDREVFLSAYPCRCRRFRCCLAMQEILRQIGALTSCSGRVSGEVIGFVTDAAVMGVFDMMNFRQRQAMAIA